MSHTQYGSIAGDAEMGGMVSPHGAILLREQTTLAMSKDDSRLGVSLIALELAGSIVGSNDRDTVQTVWMMSALDAGVVARMLSDAADRLSDDERSDFRVGFSLGSVPEE